MDLPMCQHLFSNPNKGFFRERRGAAGGWWAPCAKLHNLKSAPEKKYASKLQSKALFDARAGCRLHQISCLLRFGIKQASECRSVGRTGSVDSIAAKQPEREAQNMTAETDLTDLGLPSAAAARAWLHHPSGQIRRRARVPSVVVLLLLLLLIGNWIELNYFDLPDFVGRVAIIYRMDTCTSGMQ